MSRSDGRQLHEECGVLGIYSAQPAALAEIAYYGLFALQHRGQESAGLAVSGGCFRQRRDAGLVSEVFDSESLRELGESRVVVGHVRYSTTGGEIERNVQPIIIDQSPAPLALAHNGNLTNAAALRLEMELDGVIFHTTTDSEIAACLIARERMRQADIIEAAAAAMARLEGAYSLVFSSGDRLTVCRDPFGFRPLCMGRDKAGRLYFASESCALDSMGAELVRDILPGEIVSVGPEGVRTDRRYCGMKPRRLCVFEYIYFARPDSIIEGASVSAARQRAGRLLARESHVAADVVIGVSDSGLEGALGYAAESGIPFEQGFIKNKYIGRTFIAPGQSLREERVGIKLNPIRSVVAGKRVILIDDSLVRGTTSRRIIAQLRRAGAAAVHLRVTAPAFISPCYYGTDIDSSSGLIACGRSPEEIARLIGADSLAFLSRYSVVRLTGKDEDGFCTACFCGEYPTAVPEPGLKNQFENNSCV